MTWDQYIEERAKRLGECRNTRDFENALDEIEVDLEGYRNVPNNFWVQLEAEYEDASKLMLKEAQASAALNALLAAAHSLIRARGKDR